MSLDASDYVDVLHIALEVAAAGQKPQLFYNIRRLALTFSAVAAFLVLFFIIAHIMNPLFVKINITL